MNKKILFVDDEKQILRALRRLFFDQPYQLFFANSAKEALGILENNKIDLVISDIRMPEMDGFELLRIVKEKYPSTLRVALSGYSDSKSIYKALEENITKVYYFKPWENRELIEFVAHFMELEDSLHAKKLLAFINSLSDIPTLPDLYIQINEMIQNEENVDKIAETIESDQAAASKILRIANSAFYGSHTGSIQQAIMYVGLANVKHIVLSNSLFRIEGILENSARDLWHHAALTNRYTSLIYTEFLGKKIPSTYASAGLLHNIGMVLMLQHYIRESNESITKITTETLEAIENEGFEISHQTLGGYLLNWWELPLPIIEAALYHHDPMNECIIHKELVCVVHLANLVAWQAIESKSHLDCDQDVSALCCDQLSINSELLIEFFQNQSADDILMI